MANSIQYIASSNDIQELYKVGTTTNKFNNSSLNISGHIYDSETGVGTIGFNGDVTKIGDNAFENLSLIGITIPDSVTSIGTDAFNKCSSLTSIIIPNSVTSIGSSAFGLCHSLESITIPNSVTNIGSSAFSGCNSLTSIIIPNSVTSIGSFIFASCTSLTSIIIPNSVTSIGAYAFYNCNSLSSIIIPNSVTHIGDYAFNNCSALKTVICKTPGCPTLGYTVFSNIAANPELCVLEPISNYTSRSAWTSVFSNRIYSRLYEYENQIKTPGVVCDFNPRSSYCFATDGSVQPISGGPGATLYDGTDTITVDNSHLRIASNIFEVNGSKDIQAKNNLFLDEKKLYFDYSSYIIAYTNTNTDWYGIELKTQQNIDKTLKLNVDGDINANYANLKGVKSTDAKYASDSSYYFATDGSIQKMGGEEAEGTGHIYLSAYDSLAEGVNGTKGTTNKAWGIRSHAEGINTQATNSASHAEGLNTIADGLQGSHAEGSACIAHGQHSHAEGGVCMAFHANSHAECEATTAYLSATHSEGRYTIAYGLGSHAEGSQTLALGFCSHAEGGCDYGGGEYTDIDNFSFIERTDNANGYIQFSLNDGSLDLSQKIQSISVRYGGQFAIERYTIDSVTIENNIYKCIISEYSLSQKWNHANIYGITVKYISNIANGAASHTEGYNTRTDGIGAHAEGEFTKAVGDASHAEGQYTYAWGGENFGAAHAEGSNTFALGPYSHAEGYNTTAYGSQSHAEGNFSIAIGKASHAEGSSDSTLDLKGSTTIQPNQTTFNISDAETVTDYIGRKVFIYDGNMPIVREVIDANNTSGSKTATIDNGFGISTTISNFQLGQIAIGVSSHVEGQFTYAAGISSHAEGNGTIANGRASHAEGYYTYSNADYQHVQGKYNKKDATKAFIIGYGNGPKDAERKNIFSVDWDGNIYLSEGDNNDSKIDFGDNCAFIKYGFNDGDLTIHSSDSIRLNSKAYAQKLYFDNSSYVIGHGNTTDGWYGIELNKDQELPNKKLQLKIDGDIKVAYSNVTGVKSLDSSYSSKSTYCFATNGTIQKIGSSSAATASELGCIKIGYAQTAKSYPVQLNSDNEAFVNVPWSDNSLSITYNTKTFSNGDSIILKTSGATSVAISSNNLTISSIDTKNTAGIQQSPKKLYLVGSETMPDNTSGKYAQTFAHTGVFMQNSVAYASAFYETSDDRLKNIHQEIDLNKAYQLLDTCSTVIYDLKDDPTHKEQVGMIAQEVEEFFPEIVATDENGFKSIDYTRLSVILLRLIKDLADRVNKLECK